MMGKNREKCHAVLPSLYTQFSLMFAAMCSLFKTSRKDPRTVADYDAEAALGYIYIEILFERKTCKYVRGYL